MTEITRKMLRRWYRADFALLKAEASVVFLSLYTKETNTVSTIILNGARKEARKARRRRQKIEDRLHNHLSSLVRPASSPVRPE